jgi:hypothetical protein
MREEGLAGAGSADSLPWPLEDQLCGEDLLNSPKTTYRSGRTEYGVLHVRSYADTRNGTQLRFLLVSVLWLVTVGSRLGGWPSSGQSMCNSYR